MSEVQKEEIGLPMVLATKDSAALPERRLSLIFMRNVCHHLADRPEYFRKLKVALKPDGRIAIIEYKSGGRFSFRRMFDHYILKETIIKEMEEAGYQLEKDLDFLPEQSFTMFSS
jgi:arsenite methyltransferase